MIEKELAERFTPSEDPEFFERLWIRAEQAQRRAARRWRLTAIGAVAAAIAAVSAAGVLAFGGSAAARTVDRTFVCTSNDQGGVGVFDIAFDTGKGTYGPIGTFSVYTGAPFILYPGYYDASHFWHPAARITAEPSNCRAAPKIPLRRAALPLRARSSAPGHDKLECWATRAIFRAHVTFDAKGNAIAATVAMRNARTGKPMAYAEVTTKGLVDYAADACRHD